MKPTFEQFAHRVMSGADRSARASALRAAMSLAEPAYAAAMAARNAAFDAGVKKVHRLPRAVVSVGNVTTGGTGKTPVVRWLAERLRERGRIVAILSRGYRSAAGELGDELLMLDRCLNPPSESDRVLLRANPDRLAAAADVLRERPEVSAFVLDDAFQHRRVARDLDVVLVNAAQPFGYGHVLPRGLLREPLRGLARAGAVVVTHADQIDAHELARIDETIRRYNPGVPTYRARHAHTGFRTPDEPSSGPPSRAPDVLRPLQWFAFSGIGNPQTFLEQLRARGGSCVGHRTFPDHHAYTEADIVDLKQSAATAGAEVIVTTEKDWVKLDPLPSSRAAGPPVWRVDLRIEFEADGEAKLLAQVDRACGGRPG